MGSNPTRSTKECADLKNESILDYAHKFLRDDNIAIIHNS